MLTRPEDGGGLAAGSPQFLTVANGLRCTVAGLRTHEYGEANVSALLVVVSALALQLERSIALRELRVVILTDVRRVR